MKNTTTNDFPPRMRSLALCLYLLMLLPLALQIIIGGDGGSGFAKWLFMLCALFSYSALYLLPAFIPLGLTACFKSLRIKSLLAYISAFVAASVELVLLLDVQLLRQFGFHINGLVINLLCTRGGFESMGLDLSTILPGIVGIIVVYAGYIILARCSLKCAWAVKVGQTLRLRCGGVPALAAVALCLLVAIFSTGVADFYSDVDVLTNLETFPIVITVRMRKFMRSLGCKEPSRQEIMLESSKNQNIHYPANAITRDPNRKKYNIILLVGESMRADLLSQEAMPATWEFAQDAIRFANHYSGGNGTRAAMFTLAYGLYGLNWDNFLNNKRAPILFDWLQEDNYQFLCQTSAKFSYPEFDKTIFTSMAQEDLIEQRGANANEKDTALVDTMLNFIRNRDVSRPFFAFGFFESTHAPYTFPESCAIRQDYRRSINYSTVTERDADALRARYINSAHFVDTQLAKIYDLLKREPELAENTIVILAGDHGEEFFENGRLGHNSTFSNQQTMPVFLMKVPGMAPRTITHLTHHSDLVATLAPLLGVQNPPEDFCVGQDFLSDGYNRDHYLLCGWNIAVFLSEQYKAVLPLGAKSYISLGDMTDRNDKPCPKEDESNFFSDNAQRIMKIQQDLTRFTDR